MSFQFLYNKNNKKWKTKKFNLPENFDINKPLREQCGLTGESPNWNSQKAWYWEELRFKNTHSITEQELKDCANRKTKKSKKEIKDLRERLNRENWELVKADGRYNEALESFKGYEDYYIENIDLIEKEKLRNREFESLARDKALYLWEEILKNENHKDIIKYLFYMSIKHLIINKIKSPYFKDYIIMFRNTLIVYLQNNNCNKLYYKNLIFEIKDIRENNRKITKLYIYDTNNSKKDLRKLLANYEKEYKRLLINV